MIISKLSVRYSLCDVHISHIDYCYYNVTILTWGVKIIYFIGKYNLQQKYKFIKYQNILYKLNIVVKLHILIKTCN